MDPVTPIKDLLTQPDREELRKRFCKAVLELDFAMRLLQTEVKAIVVPSDFLTFLHSSTEFGGMLASANDLKRGLYVTACGVPILGERSLLDERRIEYGKKS